MLKNTFRHLPRFGEKAERALWEAGVVSWDCDLSRAGKKVARALRESWPRGEPLFTSSFTPAAAGPNGS